MQKIEQTAMPESLQWGCLFCKTGYEEQTARFLEDCKGVCTAFAAHKLQHHSSLGKKSVVRQVMLPGYVFFSAGKELDTYTFQRNVNFIRLLTYGNSWALRGSDLTFAQWLKEHNGILGMSKAFRVGDRVVIDSGPLKELEGVIQKVDRHNRNGLVTIFLGEKELKVWLAFEYISEGQA